MYWPESKKRQKSKNSLSARLRLYERPSKLQMLGLGRQWGASFFGVPHRFASVLDSFAMGPTVTRRVTGVCATGNKLLKSDIQAFQMGVTRASLWASLWRANCKGRRFSVFPVALYKVFDTSACKCPTKMKPQLPQS